MTGQGTERTRRRRVLLATVWLEQAHRRGIARQAREARWIFDTAEPRQIDRVLGWRGDGVICQLHPDEPEFVRAVRRLRAPKVELSDYLPSMRAPRVMPDFAACGRSVAEHFLDRGFDHIAYFREAGFAPPWAVGFEQRLSEEGRSVEVFRRPEATPPGRRNRTDRRAWLAAMLRASPKPVAVMLHGYDSALEVLDACEDSGSVVPDEVALAAFTEDEMLGDFPTVPVTTITPDYEEQARRAASLLGQLMEGEPPPGAPVLVPPGRLVVRQSSDIAAVQNPDVARAVMFVRRNLHDKNLWVPEVVRSTDLSRRSLEAAFRRFIGRSIAEEIRRLRIERAKELLRTTAVTAVAIADECGYADAKQLRRALRRATGLSPSEYRDRQSRSA